MDDLATLVGELSAVYWDRDVAPLDLPVEPTPRLFVATDVNPVPEIWWSEVVVTHVGPSNRPNRPIAVAVWHGTHWGVINNYGDKKRSDYQMMRDEAEQSLRVLGELSMPGTR